METLKVLELFGGIGACSNALKRLNIPFKIVDYVEIDKYAVKSFNAIYGTNFEPQNITTWNKKINVDLIMHGSPCQDFSLAGKQAGGDKDSGTRSSLMYETLRIVEKLRPKYVIWENVKNILSKNHIHNFNAYLRRMYDLGYKNYYQVLNAKDYGIPQNRERVFTISILGNEDFNFPIKQKLKLRLKDMLEDEVDEKYYLKYENIKDVPKERLEKIYNELNNINNFESKDNCIYDGFNNKLKCNSDTIGTVVPQNSRWGISNGYKLIKNKRLNSLIEKTNFEKGRVLNLDLYNQTTNENISQCLTEPYHNTQRLFDGLRIRKLTPKECWRLMDFSDEDFEKASKVNSDTQLYKQAGNSIVVNVLVEIFKKLFNLENNTNSQPKEKQMTIFDYLDKEVK